MPTHEPRRSSTTGDTCDGCRELELALYGRDGERGEVGDMRAAVRFLQRALWGLLVFFGASVGTLLVMSFSAGRQVEGALGELRYVMDRVNRIEVLLPLKLTWPGASSGNRTSAPDPAPGDPP